MASGLFSQCHRRQLSRQLGRGEVQLATWTPAGVGGRFYQSVRPGGLSQAGPSRPKTDSLAPHRDFPLLTGLVARDFPACMPVGWCSTGVPGPGPSPHSLWPHGHHRPGSSRDLRRIQGPARSWKLVIPQAPSGSPLPIPHFHPHRELRALPPPS